MTPDELRTIRARLGISYTALAGELGINRRTLIRWEMGDTRIPHTAARVLRGMKPRRKPAKT